ncbi:MAG TPA: polyphosphate polymerase domain-containing protein [Gemmatimonadales bacterium]|jgi:hypothetical protein|nr:polyphosphate polymerase domain-containing protein [Gemmatimonadales bacterium]
MLGHFPTAAGDLVLRRELRHRSDSKYVLPPRAAIELLAHLRHDYAVLPSESELLPLYRTLYFDTPELDLFHAHRRGRRVRHKVRIRHYPNRRLSLLEVKTRQSELETLKVSRSTPYGSDAITSEDASFVASRIGIARLVIPQAWTTFRRITLLGLHSNERVTLDLELRVEGGHRSRAFDRVVILEVKQWPYSRSTPVMEALRRSGRRPGWASKYCLAIASTQAGMPVNAFLPGLRLLQRMSG